MSKTSNEKIIEIIFETEKLADQILVNKQEIIALDKRRQETREALREIGKHDDDKVWITIGSMLIKTERIKALELLKKDQQQIDIEINKLRSNQKILLIKHRNLEFASPIKGINLKPMNPNEMSALRSNLHL